MVSEATIIEANKSTSPAVRQTSTETLFTHDKDYIYINDLQIKKDQFLYAFGGALNPTKQQQFRQFGNPAPAGLCAFGMVCITLGLINMQAKGITSSSILIGAFFFSAGIIEFVSAIWCIAIGNTFAATVFFCFFGFWTSFGCITGNVLGIQDSYATEKEFNNALGLFLMSYVFFTFMLWVCTWKSTWPFSALFFMIWLFVLLYDIGYYTMNTTVFKAGGFFCIVAGFLGLYNAYEGLSENGSSYFPVKPWFMPGATKPTDDIENYADYKHE